MPYGSTQSPKDDLKGMTLAGPRLVIEDSPGYLIPAAARLLARRPRSGIVRRGAPIVDILPDLNAGDSYGARKQPGAAPGSLRWVSGPGANRRSYLHRRHFRHA
ncbi:hypothetical protein, partial [Acidiferrobacter sp.]|uniref:hypothetical protein n=1 Tax=Acidiferrobacter sp. TaxID=1872107 RepID=UPI00261BDF72